VAQITKPRTHVAAFCVCFHTTSSNGKFAILISSSTAKMEVKDASSAASLFVKSPDEFLAAHRRWLFAALSTLDACSHDQHEQVFLALGKATLVVPHAWTFAIKFIDIAMPPFKR